MYLLSSPDHANYIFLEQFEVSKSLKFFEHFWKVLFFFKIGISQNLKILKNLWKSRNVRKLWNFQNISKFPENFEKSEIWNFSIFDHRNFWSENFVGNFFHRKYVHNFSIFFDEIFSKSSHYIKCLLFILRVCLLGGLETTVTTICNIWPLQQRYAGFLLHCWKTGPLNKEARNTRSESGHSKAPSKDLQTAVFSCLSTLILVFFTSPVCIYLFSSIFGR